MKELEPKISEIELTIDREKEPLSAKATKHAKLYLNKIKQDRLKIKFLVDCFLAYSAKWSRDTGLRPRTTVLTSNVRTEDLRLPPQKERKRAIRTENVRLDRERES